MEESGCWSCPFSINSCSPFFLISTSESTSKWFPFCLKKRRFIYTWQFCDCDLFGMVKTWPFWKGWFKWPPTSGWKGHGLNHLWYTLVNWHSNGKWTRIFQMHFLLKMGIFQPAMLVYLLVVSSLPNFFPRCSDGVWLSVICWRWFLGSSSTRLQVTSMGMASIVTCMNLLYKFTIHGGKYAY